MTVWEDFSLGPAYAELKCWCVPKYLFFISSCLVKEDEDAVRNNLAGDANPVVKEIPEFPPRHPHLHPVHMLRKIFLMKKNASHILPSPSHRLRTVRRSLFC